MDLSKMRRILGFLRGMPDVIGDLEFRIVIVKDSYFFLVDKGYVPAYYEGGHKPLRGWYTGVLSIKREGSPLYIFVSEILYAHEEDKTLFLKILYQILVYLNLDFFRFKYKKFRKHLKSFLEEHLPEDAGFNPSCLETLLQGGGDRLWEEGEAIIPHPSLYEMVERLPPSQDPIQYLEDLGAYLTPHQYMAPKKDHGDRRHN